MGVTELLLRLRSRKSVHSEAAFRDRFEGRDYPAPPPIPRALTAKCRIREREVEGHRVFTLTPKRETSPAHILYTHGGAYVNELVRPHWSIVGRLVEKTHAAVTVPIYPLAPEHSYRSTYSLMERVYRDVTATTPAGQVVLCGDSAGGGLALGQALSYRDRGLMLPGRIIQNCAQTVRRPDVAPLPPPGAHHASPPARAPRRLKSPGAWSRSPAGRTRPAAPGCA